MTSSQSPLIVAIEGIDGAGKTTLLRQLAERWPEAPVRRLPSKNLFQRTRGSVPEVRRLALLLDCVTTVARARRLRVLHVPLVLFDRSALSTAVYNGGGDAVFSLVGPHKPDLTIFLDVSPVEARRRLLLRGDNDPFLDDLPELYGRYAALTGRARMLDWNIEIVQSDANLLETVVNLIQAEMSITTS